MNNIQRTHSLHKHTEFRTWVGFRARPLELLTLALVALKASQMDWLQVPAG